MLEWACRKTDDLTKMKVVKLANPASFVALAGLEDGAESLEPSDFARYRANVWAQAADAKIKEAEWDALFDKGAAIPRGASGVVFSVDAAQKRDTTACTALWLREDGRIVPKSMVWALESKDRRRPKPAAHQYVKGERIGQRRVRNHIKKTAKENDWQVDALVFDPHYFGESAEILELDEGYTLIEFPPVPPRQAPATEALLEAIEKKGIAHDGDEVLRSHVTAGATKPVGEGNERFSKGASKKVIDALITLMMGVEPVLDDTDSPWERRAARGEEALL